MILLSILNVIPVSKSGIIFENTKKSYVDNRNVIF